MNAQTTYHGGSDDQDSPQADLSRSLLIICAHGSAYHPAANEHVLEISSTIRQSGDYADVQTIFHAGQAADWPAPDLDPGAFDQILVVPYMMSDGFLAKQMTDNAKHTIEEAGIKKPVIGTSSVGTHPAIADIVLKVATEAAEAHQLSADALSLVIVAHGSRNAPQSRIGAEAHLQSLRDVARFKETILGFIEEPPFVADVLKSIESPTVVVGLFAAPGGHAIVDIAEAMQEANIGSLINAGPIGLHPDMHDMIRLRAIEAMTP